MVHQIICVITFSECICMHIFWLFHNLYVGYVCTDLKDTNENDLYFQMSSILSTDFPTIWQLLQNILLSDTTNENVIKTNKVKLAIGIFSLSVLCKARYQNHKGLQEIFSLALIACGVGRKVIDWLSKACICSSYTTAVQILDKTKPDLSKVLIYISYKCFYQYNHKKITNMFDSDKLFTVIYRFQMIPSFIYCTTT